MAINRSADPNRSRAPKLPGIPTPSTEPRQLLRFMEVVKEYLEVRESDRATQHDRYVTFRDLEAIGIRPASLRLSSGTPKEGQVTFALAGGGFASISVAEFERAVYGSALFQNLVKRLDDPTRFDRLPALVREALLSDLAAEARLRGADIQRLERKIQDTSQSLALRTETLTASIGSSVAAVRETAWAAATEAQASAGKVTQIEARLDDVGGVTIEESIIAVADRVDGLSGEYMVKINAGNAVTGFGLALSVDPNQNSTSSFFVQADQFALVPTYTFTQSTTPSATAAGQTWYKTSTREAFRATGTGTGNWAAYTPTVPFGVDTTTGTTFINGQVRINAGGSSLDAVGKRIVVAALPPFFRTDSAGAVTPASITLTATLQGGLSGTVTWTTSPTVTLTGTGNSRAITSAAMGSNTSVAVTATVTDGGVTFSDTFTVYRVLDGQAGPQGARGSLTGYVVNTSLQAYPSRSGGLARWSIGTPNTANGTLADNVARDRIWVLLGGSGSATNNAHLQIGDTITITNNEDPSLATASVTGYWGGTSWLNPGVVIDGNLLVNGTLSASKINGGTFSGASIAISSSAGGWLLNAGFNGTTVGYRQLSGYNIDATNFADPSKSAIEGFTLSSSAAAAVRGNGNNVGHGLLGAHSNGAIGTVGTSFGGVPYDFYAVGTGTNYGPFTGAHDVLLPLNTDAQAGDIVIDDTLVMRRGLSCTLFSVRRSATPNEQGAIGVLTRVGEPLGGDAAPAAFTSIVTQVRDDGIEVCATEIDFAGNEGLYLIGSANALGEGQINVCGEGGDIARGDLIVTSSVPGKGMRQADDIVRSRTVARAREAVTFDSPNQVKQIACIYLCG
jgi:hypothetical protein